MAKTKPEVLQINQPSMPQPMQSQEIPRPRETAMSGKDLLMQLKRTGTGSSKLLPGMEVLRDNPKASAHEVYAAIENAGWRDHVRPFPGRKEGVYSRENAHAATLSKARALMAGKTVEQIAQEAREASLNQTGGLVITEAEIASIGLTPDEMVKANNALLGALSGS